MQIREPASNACFWITPGGGLEIDESIEDALKRELKEELALEQFQMGPLVWKRQHTFNWEGQRICQYEQYYLIQTERFEPCISDPIEVMILQEFRWWSLSELSQTKEAITPLTLANIIKEYLKQGAPVEPLVGQRD